MVPSVSERERETYALTDGGEEEKEEAECKHVSYDSIESAKPAFEQSESFAEIWDFLYRQFEIEFLKASNAACGTWRP